MVARRTGIEPVRLLWFRYLFKKKKKTFHRNERKLKKRETDHSQLVQRCEHSDLSGNGSAQVVLIQIPTAIEAHQSKLPQKPPPQKRCQEAKFTHSPSKDVSISIWVGMVPLRLVWYNHLQQQKKPTGWMRKRWPGNKIHSQMGQRCKHPNLSGNGSPQAIYLQSPTTTKEVHYVDCDRWWPRKQNFTHRVSKDVSIPISVEIVPASPIAPNSLHTKGQTRWCVKIWVMNERTGQTAKTGGGGSSQVFDFPCWSAIDPGLTTKTIGSIPHKWSFIGKSIPKDNQGSLIRRIGRGLGTTVNPRKAKGIGSDTHPVEIIMTPSQTWHFAATRI